MTKRRNRSQIKVDRDILQALDKDGGENLDDIVPDIVTEEEAGRMMDRAIQKALEKREKKRRRSISIRRYTVAVAATLVLLVAITPTGRALAAEAAKSIVQFFSTYIFVQTKIEIGDITKTQRIADGQYDYSSVHETAQALEHPLVGFDEGVTSSKSTLIVSSASDDIVTIYTINENTTIMVIEQIFGNEGDNGVNIYKSEDSIPIDKKLFNGADMYISYNQDGVGGYAAWDNIALMVSSSTMTIEELTDFIDQLHNIE